MIKNIFLPTTLGMIFELEVETETATTRRTFEGRRKLRLRPHPHRGTRRGQELTPSDQLLAADVDVLLPPDPLFVDVTSD